MISAGLYLSIVRDRRGLTRKQLADRLGVSVQTIANLENGKKETAWTSVAAFVRIVGANIDHVLTLTNDRSDDETLARQLAEAQLSPRSEAQIENAVKYSVKNDYSRAELDSIREALASDPEFLDTVTAAIAREVLRRRS